MTGMKNREEVIWYSADPNGTLRTLISAGAVLENIQKQDDVTLQFQVSRRDLGLLKDISLKRGERFEVTPGRRLIGQILGRPVLTAGMLLILLTAVFLPRRVLFIRVEGNQQIPSRMILEKAAESGLRFGAMRKELRNEPIKNRLLSALPGLQWAGINTAGTTAVISVQERKSPAQPEPDGICSIVAARDGQILTCTASGGNLLCRPGDAVRKGQLLVSAYSDCGRVLLAQPARGEIFARTNRTFSAVTPDQALERQDNLRSRRRFSLVIGKKRINFGKGSGISGVTCGKMVQEYSLTLPGGFRLPVQLIEERTEDWSTAPAARDRAAAAAELARFAEAYLQTRMISGRILSCREEIRDEPGTISLTGSYACVESIGRLRQEEIGECNGKAD